MHLLGKLEFEGPKSYLASVKCITISLFNQNMKSLCKKEEYQAMLAVETKDEEKERTAEFFFPSGQKSASNDEKQTQDTSSSHPSKNRHSKDASGVIKLAAHLTLAKPWRIRTKDNFCPLPSRMTVGTQNKELCPVKIPPKTSEDLPPVPPALKLRKTESTSSLLSQDAKDMQKNLLMKSRGLAFSRGNKTIRSTHDDANPLCSPMVGQSGFSFWPGKDGDRREQSSPRWRIETGGMTEANSTRVGGLQHVASSYPASGPRQTEDSGLERINSTRSNFLNTQASLRRLGEGSLPRMTAADGLPRKPIARRQLNIVARIFGDSTKAL